MKEFQRNHEISGFEDDVKINFKEEVNKYLFHWKWFLVSIIIASTCTFFYLRYTTPLYSVSSYIMVKDNMDAGISDELKAVADLGIVGTSSTNNPKNEIFIITSRKIIGRVVDSLQLNISYFSEGEIKMSEKYKNSPVRLQFLVKDSLYHNLNTSFVISIIDKNSFLVKNSEGELLLQSNFNEVIDDPYLGKFKVAKKFDILEDFNRPDEIVVVIRPRRKVIDQYKSRIQVEQVYERSSVLNLKLTDPIKLKAEHIIDELVYQYNLDAIIDKNLVSKRTKFFIDERLQSVGLELGFIQDNLKAYKTKFGVTGYSIESEIAIQAIQQNEDKTAQLAIQLSLVKWTQEEIDKKMLINEVLPINLGFSDANTAKSIEDFNQLLLRKYRLERIAGDKNPDFINLLNEIEVAKQSVLSNLKSLKKSIEIQIEKSYQEGKSVQGKVSEIPAIERGMIDIERQKFIYAELYSYLLKKKEELAISLAVTVPNAKIIDHAYGADTPVSPKKNLVYLISISLGFLFPFSFIYIKYLLDTKIRVRNDIESNLKAPYLGDIPNSGVENKIILKKGTRTSAAEAFRLLRTNLGYMLSGVRKSKLGKTIFITSTISGEGKSFVSINLAASLALTNKKVLLLGLDLRAPKLNEYLHMADKKGVTNYILEEKLELKDIKFKTTELEGVDLISSGLIPPNPSELLLNDRIEKLFEEIRKEYDYIIVDTAPVSLVTDTILIAEHADLFLFVVRANHLDKRMLIVPKTLYRERKLPNMAIILNDTDAKRGYGYGYGYVEGDSGLLYKKLFKNSK